MSTISLPNTIYQSNPENPLSSRLKRRASESRLYQPHPCEVTLLHKSNTQNLSPKKIANTISRMGHLIYTTFTQRAEILKNKFYAPISKIIVATTTENYFNNGEFLYQATIFPRSKAILHPLPVGSVIMERKESEKTGFVTDLTVDERYQRKGIARMLMQRLIEDTRKQGYKQLDLKVENPAAIKLYKSLGFQQVGDKYWDSNAQLWAYNMQLNLEKETSPLQTIKQWYKTFTLPKKFGSPPEDLTALDFSGFQKN